MFFQLSIDKEGVVSGAYQNALSGEKSRISGLQFLFRRQLLFPIAWVKSARKGAIHPIQRKSNSMKPRLVGSILSFRGPFFTFEDL